MAGFSMRFIVLGVLSPYTESSELWGANERFDGSINPSRKSWHTCQPRISSWFWRKSQKGNSCSGLWATFLTTFDDPRVDMQGHVRSPQTKRRSMIRFRLTDEQLRKIFADRQEAFRRIAVVIAGTTPYEPRKFHDFGSCRCPVCLELRRTQPTHRPDCRCPICIWFSRKCKPTRRSSNG